MRKKIGVCFSLALFLSGDFLPGPEPQRGEIVFANRISPGTILFSFWYKYLHKLYGAKYLNISQTRIEISF